MPTDVPSLFLEKKKLKQDEGKVEVGLGFWKQQVLPNVDHPPT